MIKLNNKNITYVALADSSSSIKAPKEIWYADTNNSVKLVYRRKDALIEGEDYEKYHWLNGDGSAYISQQYNVWQNRLECEVYFNEYAGNNRRYIVCSGSDYNCSISAATESENYYLMVIYRNDAEGTSHIKDISTQGRYLINLYQNNNKSYTDISGITYNGRTIYENTWNTDKKFKIFSKKLSYIRELLPNNAYRSNLVPCKLLKPVPKWLDANGIRRQVGECGMIDLVSGKFYGNVNNVGTFTVENYYERKEWLKGDGSAYIQISQTSRTDFNINLTYKLSNVYKQILYGSFYSTSGGWKGNMLTWGETNGIADKILLRISTSNGNNYRKLGAQDVDVVHTIKVVDGRCYFDDVDKGVCPGYSIYNYDKPFLLFNGYNVNTITESNASNASISKFSIEGYCNLIPCTLTMDLPASMDANNIARTKGTSGMWDLVSDRFYGNVANSGTFKAVNLAEGVDYEVHDWLVGDGSAYIQGIKYDLWNNHLQMRIGKVREELSPINYIGYYDSVSKSYLIVRLTYYAAIENNTLNVIFRENATSGHIANISPYSSMNEYVDFDFYINNTEPTCERDGVIFTNSSTNVATQSNWTSIQPQIHSAKMSYIREVLPNDTYSSNLIPVKLLRSIPAKYDANGIARQAGECGMYDTVNDVFYGNVASSGSFTVEDDN